MNVLIADDELLIRKSVIRVLQKVSDAGYKEAEDGIEALEKIREFRPELVIADIRMPGMNGLELLAEAKKVVPNIMFVFLSGYDLFEYARQAIQLGGLGYLLKPVKEEDLLEMLDTAFERLTLQRTARHTFLQMEREARQGLTVMRKQFLQQLMQQGNLNSSYVASKLKEYGIEFPYRHFVVMHISIDGYSQNQVLLPAKEQELFKYALENIATELAKREYAMTAYACDLDEGIVLLLNYGEDAAIVKRSSLNALANQIRTKVAGLMPFRITIGLGNVFGDLADCGQSCTIAEKATRQRLVRGGNAVYDGEALPAGAIRQQSIDAVEEQHFLHLAEKGDRSGMMRFIRDKYAVYQEAAAMYDTGPLLKLNFQMVLLLSRTLQRIGIVPEGKLGDELKMYNELNACISIPAIVDRIDETISLCLDDHSLNVDAKDGKWVQRALEYVHLHFHEDLTLSSVAEHVHLSPNYLSKLFKEEIGRSFTDYVLNYRMERARSLLQEGVYKANQVAGMVGFQNEKYFYRVFKKVTGYSPGEYRKL